MIHVLILGAGPAGSSTAIQLLKAGYEVTILDRAEFPRSTPGETLHPGIEPLLKQLGVLDIVLDANFVRHNGVENIRNGSSSFAAYNENEVENWRGFQLFRKEFDTVLLNKAIVLGAKFQFGVTPIKVNHSEGFITSVETNKGKFDADFFIDATGKRAWLAQKVGIHIKRYSKKRIAYFGYVKSLKNELPNPKLIWDQTGWTWIAQVTDDKISWARLDLLEHRKLSKDWLPKELREYETIESRKAVDVTWRKAEKCCMENLFVVGDAAFVLDPGSSHGVLKAIMSGIMVADLVRKSLKLDLEFVQDYYNKWINHQFQKDVSVLKELYASYSEMA